MRYEGMSALVTGASSGIGEAFARELHRRGAAVMLVARREDRLLTIAADLNQLRPDSAEVIVADLAAAGSQGAVLGLPQLLEKVGGRGIDLLVSNAGSGSFGYFETLPIERERAMIALNVTATVELAHLLAAEMKVRRAGAIISISSIAGFQPVPYMATYSATKAFNFTHSLALRQELAPFGVRVLTVCPGPIATEFGGVARVPGTWTGGGRDTAETVARESLDALARNRAWIVTGPRARLIAFFSRMIPTTLATWVTKKMLDPVMKQLSQN